MLAVDSESDFFHLRPNAEIQADTDAWARLGTELMDIIHRNFALNATEDQITKRQKVKAEQEGVLCGDPKPKTVRLTSSLRKKSTRQLRVMFHGGSISKRQSTNFSGQLMLRAKTDSPSRKLLTVRSLRTKRQIPKQKMNLTILMSRQMSKLTR